MDRTLSAIARRQARTFKTVRVDVGCSAFCACRFKCFDVSRNRRTLRKIIQTLDPRQMRRILRRIQRRRECQMQRDAKYAQEDAKLKYAQVNAKAKTKAKAKHTQADAKVKDAQANAKANAKAKGCKGCSGKLIP